MKIIVTGGAGFIGSHIVDSLVEKGADVHVIDNYTASKREDRINKKATYHEVDIRDYKSLAPVVKGAKYLFHEAALPSVQISIEQPLETFSVNAQGTINVLQAAHEGGVERVIFASTCAVYGDQETMPLVENMTPYPKSPYGAQKLTSEVMCRMWSEVYGLQTVCLRYLNVYGPRFNLRGAYTAALGKFILQRLEDKPMTIWGDGTQTRDYIHVSDIVNANLLAMKSTKVGAGEVINIGTGKSISVNELAKLIGGPVTHEEGRKESKHVLVDLSKAKNLLGYEPMISLEKGVSELKELCASKKITA